MDFPEWAFLVSNLENPLLIDVIWAELVGGIPHLKTRLFTPPSSLPLFVFQGECFSLVLRLVRTPWEEPIPIRHGRELCEIWAFKCFINKIQEDLCFKSSPAISRAANPAEREIENPRRACCGKAGHNSDLKVWGKRGGRDGAGGGGGKRGWKNTENTGPDIYKLGHFREYLKIGVLLRFTAW